MSLSLSYQKNANTSKLGPVPAPFRLKPLTSHVQNALINAKGISNWQIKEKIMKHNKDGNLRIAGANNILGADAFQFTEEKGILHLQATGLAGIGFDLEYEIVDDALHISIGRQKMTLYRTKSSDLEGFNPESSEPEGFDVENVQEALEDWAEDALDAVQVYSLYGTWTDSSGAISFTFSKDGKLSVSGLEDTLSVDAFTFSEVDNDTLQLKAESDNPIIGAIGLNMDYEIEGDSMTVTIAGKELSLVKKK